MSERASVQTILGLRVPPVAVAFLEEPPAGVAQRSGDAVPAGCAFWQEAQNGEAFYTVPSDHFNCAVGAYTHSLELPPERSGETMATVGFMVENGYIEMEEVAGIPKLAKSPGYVAYAPAEAERFAPDVVVITLKPAQAMIAYEAAIRAGAGNPLTNTLGRPSCGVLPFSYQQDAAAVSLGCTGNRLYAGLREDEMYLAVPGSKWTAFRDALDQIVAANERMRAYYEAHASQVQG